MIPPDITPIITMLQGILETGSRWERHGFNPRTGCGCYGLVVFTFARAGMTLPETAEQAQQWFVPVCKPYHAWDVALVQWTPMERHLGLQSSNGLARFALSHPLWRRGLRHVWRYCDFATVTEGVCT